MSISFPRGNQSHQTAADLGEKKLSRALKDYRARSWEGQAIFLSERFEEARADLARWEEQNLHSAMPPLAGMTMAVKACFDVDGWTTSCASRAMSDDAAATHNAALVDSLVRAGATVLAQTNMTEIAYGALGVNTAFGTPRTPLDPSGQRVAGGSSSGSAVAVSRGYCDFSVCSDTSGSARIPAAFCGVVGFKPRGGSRPRRGRPLFGVECRHPSRAAELPRFDGLGGECEARI